MSSVVAVTSRRARSLGVLLVGHGTREVAGRMQFQGLARLVRGAIPEIPVEACFLELSRPSIAEGIARLAGAGTTHIVVVPLMLFAAGHVRRDIPRQVAAALSSFPDLRSVQCAHLGCESSLIELSAARFRQVLSADEDEPWGDEVGWLLIGRGNRDPEAQAELARFAALRRERTPVAWTEICYLAMARPSLAEGLERAAARPASPIVIQPHLLFSGVLTEQVRRDVSDWAHRASHRRWRLAEPLGPHPLLAEAVVRRVLEIDGAGEEPFATPERADAIRLGG